MSIKNKVQLVGHVGQDPEIRTFGDSGKLAKFSVATNESYQNRNGEWQETTTWHNLIAWRIQADKVEKYIKKGAYVLIEGKLVNRDYTGQDNIKRYITEIDVQRFMLLDKKTADNGEFQPVTNGTELLAKASAEDDDLPF